MDVAMTTCTLASRIRGFINLQEEHGALRRRKQEAARIRDLRQTPQSFSFYQRLSSFIIYYMYTFEWLKALRFQCQHELTHGRI